MDDDPFLTLVVEALNLMHPRFAAGLGRAYGPGDGAAAGRRVLERAFGCEFYHAVRALWDKAIPVRLGLGHVVVQGEPPGSPLAGGPVPDLLLWKIGERGQPDARLGAVSLALASNPPAVADAFDVLRRHAAGGYPYAVAVVVGRVAELPDGGPPRADGVRTLFFNVDRWVAVVAG